MQHQQEGAPNNNNVGLMIQQQQHHQLDAPTLIRTITGLRYEIKHAVNNLRFTARRMDGLPGHLNTWKAQSEHVLKELVDDDEHLSPQERKHRLRILNILQQGIYQEFVQYNRIDSQELPSRIQQVQNVYERNDRILQIVLERGIA